MPSWLQPALTSKHILFFYPRSSPDTEYSIFSSKYPRLLQEREFYLLNYFLHNHESIYNTRPLNIYMMCLYPKFIKLRRIKSIVLFPHVRCIVDMKSHPFQDLDILLLELVEKSADTCKDQYIIAHSIRPSVKFIAFLQEHFLLFDICDLKSHHNVLYALYYHIVKICAFQKHIYNILSLIITYNVTSELILCIDITQRQPLIYEYNEVIICTKMNFVPD